MHDLTEAIIEQGHVPSFLHDLFDQSDIQMGLQELVSDWERPESDDASTTLALLDILMFLIFDGISPSFIAHGKGIMDMATSLARSISQNYPDSMKSRPYTRWLLARSYSYGNEQDPQMSTSFKQHLIGSAGLFWKPPRRALPQYIPLKDENPGWKQPDATPEVLQGVKLVLNTSRELGDYKTEVLALKRLIQLSKSPVAHFEDLCEVQKLDQGDIDGYLDTLLSKYLVANSEESRAQLKTDFGEQIYTPGFKDSFSTDKTWFSYMLYSSLEGTGPRAEDAARRADEYYRLLDEELCDELDDKMPELRQRVYDRQALVRYHNPGEPSRATESERPYVGDIPLEMPTTERAASNYDWSDGRIDEVRSNPSSDEVGFGLSPGLSEANGIKIPSRDQNDPSSKYGVSYDEGYSSYPGFNPGDARVPPKHQERAGVTPQNYEYRAGKWEYVDKEAPGRHPMRKPPIPPPTKRQPEHRRGSIYNDPNVETLIDLSSEESSDPFTKREKPYQKDFNWDEPRGKKDNDNGGVGVNDSGGTKSGDASGAGDASGIGEGANDNGDNKDDAEEAKQDDEWGSFKSVGKKKKGKKSGVAQEMPDSTFHEIKLDEPGTSLNLDFSGGPPSGKGNSFGAWGSSWNTGSSWGFSGVKDTAAKEDKAPDEKKKEDESESNLWSINRSKPKKRSTYFTIGGTDELKEEAEAPTAPENETTDVAADDFWGSWSVSRKAKKEKAIVEEIKEPEQPAGQPPSTEPEPKPARQEENDVWVFPTSKKGKKKKKKDIFFWADLGSGPKSEKPKESEPPAILETSKGDDVWDDVWGTSKKKGGFVEELDESDHPVPSIPPVEPDTEPEPKQKDDDDWMIWGKSSKKSKDKKKKGQNAGPEEESKRDPPATQDSTADDIWGFDRSKKSKKNTDVVQDDNPPTEPGNQNSRVPAELDSSQLRLGLPESLKPRKDVQTTSDLEVIEEKLERAGEDVVRKDSMLTIDWDGATTLVTAQHGLPKVKKLNRMESVVGGLITDRVTNSPKKDIEEDKRTGRSRSRSRTRSEGGGLPTRIMPTLLPPTQSEIDRIRDDAYHAGRADERYLNESKPERIIIEHRESRRPGSSDSIARATQMAGTDIARRPAAERPRGSLANTASQRAAKSQEPVVGIRKGVSFQERVPSFLTEGYGAEPPLKPPSRARSWQPGPPSGTTATRTDAPHHHHHHHSSSSRPVSSHGDYAGPVAPVIINNRIHSSSRSASTRSPVRKPGGGGGSGSRSADNRRSSSRRSSSQRRLRDDASTRRSGGIPPPAVVPYRPRSAEGYVRVVEAVEPAVPAPSARSSKVERADSKDKARETASLVHTTRERAVERGILPVVTRRVAVAPVDRKGKGNDVAAPEEPAKAYAGMLMENSARERAASERRSASISQLRREPEVVQGESAEPISHSEFSSSSYLAAIMDFAELVSFRTMSNQRNQPQDRWSRP